MTRCLWPQCGRLILRGSYCLTHKPTYSTPSWQQAAREVRKRDGFACVLCGKRGSLEVDHIRPRAMGGSDALDNLRLICRVANRGNGSCKS